MTTSTDTPTNAAPQLPSATKPPLDIVGWLLTYSNDETDFVPGPVKPQHLAADCDGIAAVVLLCDAVQFTRQTVSQRITNLEAEVARLKQREHICETMDQAEKIALVRALQECAEDLGIGDTNPSPAALVAAVTAACSAATKTDGAIYQGAEAPEDGHWLLGDHNAGKLVAELQAECKRLYKLVNHWSTNARHSHAERNELRMWKAAAVAQEPVAWQCRFSNSVGRDRCTQEHYAHVRQNPAAWPDYEVRALIASPMADANDTATPGQRAAQLAAIDEFDAAYLDETEIIGAELAVMCIDGQDMTHWTDACDVVVKNVLKRLIAHSNAKNHLGGANKKGAAHG